MRPVRPPRLLEALADDVWPDVGTINPRPVHWLWADRLAAGTLALVGGREGIGKSLVGYTVAAMVTTGKLQGRHFGQPKAVIVAATEDSWAHTIVPRLMAAGADLDRVYRVDVTTAAGADTTVSLPRDLAALGEVVAEVGAALVLLDPLMSRLDANLDTHKDAEVRLALEPLTAVAERTGVSVLGLIHVNKSTSTDPLTMLMASRALAAVARAVLFVMTDPDDEAGRLLGQPKNNLGRTDLPTLTFRNDSAHVADTDDGPVWTGRLQWTGETERSVADAMADTQGGPTAHTAASEAADWLADYLTSKGGSDDSATTKREAARQQHSTNALQRARKKLHIRVESHGFPRTTHRVLPEQQSPPPVVPPPGESSTTRTTGTTGQTGHDSCSSRSSRLDPPETDATTECTVCSQPLLVPIPGRDLCARCQPVTIRHSTTSRQENHA